MNDNLAFYCQLSVSPDLSQPNRPFSALYQKFIASMRDAPMRVGAKNNDIVAAGEENENVAAKTQIIAAMAMTTQIIDRR